MDFFLKFDDVPIESPEQPIHLGCFNFEKTLIRLK